MTKLYCFCLALLLISGCKSNSTIHPQRKDIIETVYASGKITADSEYTVYALSPGMVIKKLVKEGDAVSKNQLLYVINNTAPAAKLDAANISYSTARHNLSANSSVLNDLKISRRNAEIKFTNDSLQYTRLKNLWAENIGTKSTLDNAEMQYRMSMNEKLSAREKYYSTVNDLNISLKNARSQVATAQNDLNNYIIRAQSAGTIYQTLKENGESVKANEAIAMIGKSADRVIRLSVDQQDISRIKIGQEVLLKTDIGGDHIYKAKVTRTYPVMNEADQTFRVDAVFADNQVQPYIHTSVEANIIIQRKQQCLVIPSRVLLNGDSIRLSQNGHEKTISVKTGIHTLNEVEILGGIDEKADIIAPSSK
jgi:multidrug efflux pump subunit AcrA (membrane-fusion protein)